MKRGKVTEQKIDKIYPIKELKNEIHKLDERRSE
jgi:hypothetical protein